MGIRSNVEIILQLGRDNSLSLLTFDEDFTQLLDTLDHAESGTLTIDAGASGVSLPFGAVSQARLVYVKASGAFRLNPGGAAATVAHKDGVGGSYPTGFAGGEHLDLKIDGTVVTVPFLIGDQSLVQVTGRINSVGVLIPILQGTVPWTIARNNGSNQLRLISPTSGSTSSVEVLNTTTGSVLTALGLSVGVVSGTNSTPGQTPLTSLLPASTSASDEAASVRAFVFATMATSALTIDNLDPDNTIEVVYAVCGDVVTTPPPSC
jgi:hypothetical protein